MNIADEVVLNVDSTGDVVVINEPNGNRSNVAGIRIKADDLLKVLFFVSSKFNPMATTKSSWTEKEITDIFAKNPCSGVWITEL